jgi:CRP-like cAMP-binding protein
MLVIPHFYNWHKDLNPATKAEIEQLSKTKKVSKGQYIYTLGEKSDACYQLVSGRVNICVFSKEGDYVVISTMHVGDCFGDVGLINERPRSNYAVASEDCVVSVLSQKNYQYLILKFPDMLISINKSLADRCHLAVETLEDVYLLPLYQRVAKTLIRLALNDGTTKEDNSIEVVNISQEKIGLMVGATRQSISRELKRMEKDNMLSLKYNKLTIPNLPEMIERLEESCSLEFMISDFRDKK